MDINPNELIFLQTSYIILLKGILIYLVVVNRKLKRTSLYLKNKISKYSVELSVVNEQLRIIEQQLQ